MQVYASRKKKARDIKTDRQKKSGAERNPHRVRTN